MSRFSDQIIVAYVDGELDPQWVSELEAAMEADPALAQRVVAHTGLRDVVAGAFGGAMSEPVPERLLVAAGVTVSAKLARPRFGAPRGFGLPQWAAMAACLVAGVVAGRMLMDLGPIRLVEGGLHARGELAIALNEKLSAETGPIQVGLTFRDKAGAYCRTFQMQADAMAGVACRTGEGWDLRMTTRYTARSGGDYRMAGSAGPPAVLAYVDEAMSGAALDRRQEIAARKSGWR